MSEPWADVRTGQKWVSRDKRDGGKTVTVMSVGHEHVVVMGFRMSRVRKDNFHKLYRAAS
jgi:hypothetical protein